MAEIGVEHIEILPETVILSGGELAPPPLRESSVRTTEVHNTQLPVAAVKVRNVVAEVGNLVGELIDGKVIVQGIIHTQLYYVDTGGLVRHLAEDISFSTFIDLLGAQPGMNAHVTAVIEEILTELTADGLRVTQKVVAEVFVKITETIQAALKPGVGPLLLLEQVIGEGTKQTLIEKDVELQVPALKIDEVVARLQNLETEVIADKVVIQGILHQQIFFIGEDERAYHQAEDVPFSAFIDILGAMPGMTTLVQGNLEAVRFSLSAPRALHQKAVVELFVKVVATTREYVSEGMGPLFKAVAWVNENTTQIMRESVVTLPLDAVRIQEIIPRFRGVTAHLYANKALVQGSIHKQIFFIGTDRIAHHLAEEVPFTTFIDLPGAVSGDQITISQVVEGFWFDLETPRQLRQRLVAALTAVVGREMQLHLELTAGPYSVLEHVVGEATRQVLVVRRTHLEPPPPPPPEPVIVSEVVLVDPQNAFEAAQQTIVHNQVVLPIRALSIKKVDGEITKTKYRVIASGVVVEGIVAKEVSFVAMDHVVHLVNEEVPFTIMVAMPEVTPQTAVAVNTRLEDISFALDSEGERLDQMLVLEAAVTAQEPATTTTLVTDVSGTGVTQAKVRAVGFVLLATGQSVWQEFDVVTEVAGPRIVRVDKEVVMLNLVAGVTLNPVPVEAVVKVVLE